NNLLGMPARLQQIFLGDLKSDAFLPFQTNGKVNFHGIKSILNQYNFYLQDEWKLRQSLTFNYGVRWEINRPPSTAGDRVFVPNVPITTPFSGTPAVNKPGAVSFVKADSWFKRDNLTAIGPRLGIAWSPTAKGGLLAVLFGKGNQGVIRA